MNYNPPRIALNLFRSFCHPKLRDSIEGDLMELYNERVKEFGKRKADRKFIVDVLILFRPSIIRPIKGSQNLTTYSMIKSYYTVAFRSLKRNKLHSSINIVGLAIGMACCIFIALFVQFELGYDRQNKDADKIFRMGIDLEANRWAISAFPIGALLKNNFPEVEKFTRIKPTEVLVRNSTNNVKYKEKIFYADSSVFDVLDIKLLKGNPATALSEINSMVITEDKAKIYFGDEDPIGKTLTLPDNKSEYKITGVFRPLPSNSHVHTQIMVSSDNFEPMRPDSKQSWNYLTNHYTYLVLPKNIDYEAFAKKISAFMDKYQNISADQPPNRITLQPLTSIHLHSNLGLEVEPNGDINTVYILSAIAFFILVIACINFMNLSTAQSLKRAREVGIRKVIGSRKSQLITQFLSESVVVSCIALVLSVVILTLITPAFNSFSGKEIVLDPITNGYLIVFFFGITFFVGIVGGIYPAFFLSGFQPTSVLKGSFARNFKGQFLRKGLVVFQFAIAFVIMVGTYVVYSQLDFMQSKNLGFDREQTLILQLPKDSVGDDALKNEMAKLTAVRNVTRMLEVPGNMVRTTGIWYEGSPENKDVNMYIFSGDPDLVKTMGMTMLTGNFFRPETKQFYKEFVINETALKRFGWKMDEAVGKLMNFGERGKEPGRVIGVIKDFHFKHLQDAIDPLVIYLEPNFESHFMALKLKPGNLKESIADIEKTWRRVVPQHDFEYQFLDERFGRLFEQERRLGQLFSIFSSLALFISCLGLFGLASFTLEQGRKSVAVRKVMGASVSEIVMMMSKDFLKLVLMGMLLAAPVAYFAMNRWLQGFVYNVGFGWIVFFYAAVVGLVVAFTTVSYHSLKAALSNPVESLKSE
ncbi:MAG: acidobacterial duplicated orphan permease [Cytophagales bacterium]|jgi:putative ABC transport system permease protein|nr:ABC transporter permease [Bacteroidota bacterium]MBS1979784.1 ABC transporter permease [Bacteroidota bacterium]WHZ07039.1 MAG: acidobacterial duplicated orphan permease [Cytophagales bacterium]